MNWTSNPKLLFNKDGTLFEKNKFIVAKSGKYFASFVTANNIWLSPRIRENMMAIGMICDFVIIVKEAVNQVKRSQLNIASITLAINLIIKEKVMMLLY